MTTEETANKEYPNHPDRQNAFMHGYSVAIGSVATIKQLQEENARLKTTMIAAAEEIQAHWPAHCDSDGYGPSSLMHRLERGISSGYPGYNAGQFTKMEEENQRLKEALKDCIDILKHPDVPDIPERLENACKLIEP